jgi:hypothetical protein
MDALLRPVAVELVVLLPQYMAHQQLVDQDFNTASAVQQNIMLVVEVEDLTAQVVQAAGSVVVVMDLPMTKAQQAVLMVLGEAAVV